MANLKYTSLKVTSPLSVAAIVLCSVSAMAQNATDICRPRASAGDSSRAGSEVGRGEGTAEESPPAGGVMDETDCSRLADNAELTQRQSQAYIQRSESPRSPEESLYLGTRAAVEGSPSVRQSAAH
jgi:hypothetical protein